MLQLLSDLGIGASLWVIVPTFWVAYFVARTFFFKPVTGILEERHRRIEGAQRDFDEAQERTTRAIAEQQARVTEARQQARSRRDEIRRQARARRQEVLAEAKREADRHLRHAFDEIHEKVRLETAALEARAEALADQMAERLLGRAI